MFIDPKIKIKTAISVTLLLVTHNVPVTETLQDAIAGCEHLEDLLYALNVLSIESRNSKFELITGESLVMLLRKPLYTQIYRDQSAQKLLCMLSHAKLLNTLHYQDVIDNKKFLQGMTLVLEKLYPSSKQQKNIDARIWDGLCEYAGFFDHSKVKSSINAAEYFTPKDFEKIIKICQQTPDREKAASETLIYLYAKMISPSKSWDRSSELVKDLESVVSQMEEMDGIDDSATTTLLEISSKLVGGYYLPDGLGLNNYINYFPASASEKLQGLSNNNNSSSDIFENQAFNSVLTFVKMVVKKELINYLRPKINNSPQLTRFEHQIERMSERRIPETIWSQIKSEVEQIIADHFRLQKDDQFLQRILTESRFIEINKDDPDFQKVIQESKQYQVYKDNKSLLEYKQSHFASGFKRADPNPGAIVPYKPPIDSQSFKC